MSRKGGLLTAEGGHRRHRLEKPVPAVTSWSAKAEERLVAQAGKKDNLLFEQASHKALAVGKQV